MSRQLNIVVAAGGTAGHINPALAFAEEMAARGHHVTFFGQTAKLEGRLVPEAGFDFEPIVVSGLDRSRPWTAVTALVKVGKARGDVGRWMKAHGPADAAVGFGAYVEMPLLSWSAAHRVPVVLHEQNSTIGLANKMLAKNAAAICVSYPKAAEQFMGFAGPRTKIVQTGNPVRKSVVEGDGAAARKKYGIPEDATLLVVFGGSLGAKTLNEAMAAMKDGLLARDGVYVLHATGRDGFDEAAGLLGLTEAEKERYKLVPYVDDMGDVLNAADLVLSRAGASSLAEIEAVGVPAVLVPYPFATEDHQTTNARHLVDAGAACMVADNDMHDEAKRAVVFELLDNGEARRDMAERAKGLAGAGAAARLADEVERACGARQ
jgi:UDP-N-acetylglucosamine--N-acetylmuramyl-(pentapeptide) pyrophosphoryl-undecaprenol N-acetylglucosamine transferase